MNNNKKERLLNGRKLRDRRGETLFIDLRRANQNVYEKKYVMFDDEQIAFVKKIYDDWQSEDKSAYHDVPELCKSASRAEIEKQNYSLAPSKYIEFIDHDLEIDYTAEMARIQKIVRKQLNYDRETIPLLENSFKEVGYDVK